MSFVIAVTLNNSTLIAGDKRSSRNEETDDNVRKIYKFNNILIGYVGIKERCEFYLSQLADIDLFSAESVYLKLCNLISNDNQYYNDKTNVSNYIIIGKDHNKTIHYKIHSYQNNYEKVFHTENATISYLISPYVTELQINKIIDSAFEKHWPSLEHFLRSIVTEVSKIDESVSSDCFIEFLQ